MHRYLRVYLAMVTGLALLAAQETLLVAATFTNPIVASGADPWVIQKDGHYYLCQSRGSRGIWVARAERLEEIGKGPKTLVWSPPRGKPYSREIWAPELHYLRGKWFIYFAADDGDNANHRMHALEGSSQNPQDPFVFRGKVAASDDRWAIDGTVVEIQGKLYFMWSGWEGTENVAQDLYIAAMSDPLTISGTRTRISRPDHDWEQVGRPLVNEGPEALWKNGRLFIIYSASGSWGDHYCLGQLTWIGEDPLKAGSWVKESKPVFRGTREVISPGHGSFVKSPDGREDWMVYHAAKRPGAGWDRDVRIQRFTWNADGSPAFGTPVAAGVPLVVPSGSMTNRPAEASPAGESPDHATGSRVDSSPD